MPQASTSAFAQRLDQEAHRAAGVEDRARLELADDAVGDPAEELEPVLVAAIRNTALPLEVVRPELDARPFLPRIARPLVGHRRRVYPAPMYGSRP